MRVLSAIGAFKGAPPSVVELNNAVATRLSKPGIETKIFPIADGGDGTLDAISFHSALQGTIFERKFSLVKNPLGELINATWLYNPKNKTAILELAQASGLALIEKNKRDPFRSTTYGTGELILNAINNGAKTIYLTVGGSATVDMGVGLLSALGAKFYDSKGQELVANVSNLEKISRIDLSAVRENLKEIDFTILADGKGVFSDSISSTIDPDLIISTRQKFSEPHNPNQEELQRILSGYQNFSKILDTTTGRKLSAEEYMGASGGVPYSLIALLGVKLEPGLKFINQRFNLRNAVNDSDLIITGEGTFDQSSLNGKSPSGVIELAKELGKRVIVLCGQCQKSFRDDSVIDLTSLGVHQIIQLMPEDWGKDRVEDAVRNTLKLLFESVPKLNL